MNRKIIRLEQERERITNLITELDFFTKQTETLDLSKSIDRETKEHALKMMKGVLKIKQDWTRTEVELRLLVEQAMKTNKMDVGNWMAEKIKEMAQLNRDQLSQFYQFLMDAKHLDDVDGQIFSEAVKDSFHYCQQSIQENDRFLREQSRKMIENSGIDLTPLQNELQQLAQMEMFKQLEYKPDED